MSLFMGRHRTAQPLRVGQLEAAQLFIRSVLLPRAWLDTLSLHEPT